MHTRLLSFTGATNIDAGVDYLRDEALPILNAQKGYRGVTASADRDNAVFSILSLWDTEADRAASDSALGKARDEALKIVGGTMSVENLEEVASVITKRPVVGCSLFVSRVSMDPANVDQNIEFFNNEVLPQIKGRTGLLLTTEHGRPKGRTSSGRRRLRGQGLARCLCRQRRGAPGAGYRARDQLRRELRPGDRIRTDQVGGPPGRDSSLSMMGR